MEPLLVVISSAASDEDCALRNDLEKQLQTLVRQDLIRVWHAGHVRAGEPTHEVTLRKIRSARIILPLLSPDYLSADEYDNELRTALARSADARVMPVLLRPCTFPGTPLKDLKLLPEGGTAVSKWSLPDDAWVSVARSVRAAVADIRAGKSHYVAAELLRTEPMVPLHVSHGRAVSPLSGAAVSVRSPASTPRTDHPASARAQAATSSRPSIVSLPPAAPSSIPGAAPDPRASLAAQAPIGSSPAVERRTGALKTLAVLLLGALLGTSVWKGWLVSPPASGPSVSGLPSGRTEPSSQSAAPPTAPAAAPSPKSECCGGVDCPDAERNVADSVCERYPCLRCSSGRRRVEGACASDLLYSSQYVLRPGQAVVNKTSVAHDARICLRRAGTTEPETCSTANEARAGKARAHPWPVTVGQLLSGPGVDFRIEVGGVVVAEEKGALVTGTSLKNSALCVGAILHGTRSPGSSVTVFLDDP